MFWERAKVFYAAHKFTRPYRPQTNGKIERLGLLSIQLTRLVWDFQAA